VRLNAAMTQNVVTYTVEVNTDNSDGRLLPYLTANLKFLASERQNVLFVPNSALRWAPQPGQVAPESRDKRSTGSGGEARPRGASAPGAVGEGQVRGTVWVPAGSLVRAIPVQIGLTDSSFTEVRGDGLQEGTLVVVGEQQKEAGKSASSSPFTPQLFQQRGQRQ